MSYSLGLHGKPDERPSSEAYYLLKKRALLLISLDPSMAWHTQVQALKGVVD
jgi:hypothetical protein